MAEAEALAAQLQAALGPGFVVEQALGEGGFAVVFRVRDLGLKRNLAVKVLSPDVIASYSVLERFRREAETVAQLAHPNIVPLHFLGDQDGLLWLAMQCVEGGSIADRLKAEGRLPNEDAARIMGEVAAALAHAHRRGVIHRDIKPANVLVDAESGRCLVTDFGIARTADAARLTSTGMMIGTPAYLSPEQVAGETVDHRVDLYALGVMAYEMVAGRVPFDAPTPTAALLQRLAEAPPPIEQLRPDVPKALAAAITGCLQSDPEKRFQTADEVMRVLDGEAVASRAVGAHSPRARARVRNAWIAAGAVASAVLAGGVWRSMAPRGDAKPAAIQQGSIVPPRDANLVDIHGGDYPIGTDAGRANARPRHVVRLAAFQVERTEVTVGAYARYVSATHAVPPWTGLMPDSTIPVTGVSWGDAGNYCAWKYGARGHLPTEEQWEAAARGTEGREFPFGAHIAPAMANTASARRTGPVPVGSFPRGATPEGVQDMSGNVWEWTSSRMAAYPGGAALPDSLSRYRVIRGGAFDTSDSLATVWLRGYLPESATARQLPNTGFRCVVDASR